MKKLLGIVVLGLLLSSCATVPSLEYSYPTGGQFTSHVVMGYDDENVKIRANQECAKFNKNSRSKNLIKRYEGGLGKILGEGGEYDIWIYDCEILKAEEQTTSSSNTKKTTSSSNSKKGKDGMVASIKGIPGVADAGWSQDISLWIFMSNPNAGHDFDRMGYTVCNGGVTNFAVPKGYSITFWNAYTKKEIGKFRCY